MSSRGAYFHVDREGLRLIGEAWRMDDGGMYAVAVLLAWILALAWQFLQALQGRVDRRFAVACRSVLTTGRSRHHKMLARVGVYGGRIIVGLLLFAVASSLDLGLCLSIGLGLIAGYGAFQSTLDADRREHKLLVSSLKPHNDNHADGTNKNDASANDDGGRERDLEAQLDIQPYPTDSLPLPPPQVIT
jgi:hypothetical protein